MFYQEPTESQKNPQRQRKESSQTSPPRLNLKENGEVLNVNGAVLNAIELVLNLTELILDGFGC